MYQLQSPHVGFALHVLPEIETVHVLVDKSEGVASSGIHPHERHHVDTSMVKEAAYTNFVVKSLQGNCQYCARHRKMWLQRTAMT